MLTRMARKYSVNILTYLVGFLFVVYLWSMVVEPIMSSCADWNYVQKVWYDWQSFNVGVLALLSSAIALGITVKASNRRIDEQNQIVNRKFKSALSLLLNATHKKAEKR